MGKIKTVLVKYYDLVPILVVGLFIVSQLFFRQWQSPLVQFMMGILGALAVLVLTVSALWGRNSTRMAKNEKVIELALAQVERLEGMLTKQTPSETAPNPRPSTEHWPWGDHHTEHLGHLSAAARRFWKLYDPTDKTTAPVNKDVAEWLVNERKVSKTMADSIASILRADDLPTGPRK